nr:MAG: hypothetical protein [Hemigrapsus takanoi nimavirus]
MASAIHEITDEHLGEFVKRVFPQFTDTENNIMSEEAMMEVLSEEKKDPEDMLVDDIYYPDDDLDADDAKLIIDEDYYSSEEEMTCLEEGGEEEISELEDVLPEDVSLTEEIFEMLRKQEIQSLDLSDCVITEDDDKKSSPSSKYRFLDNMHPNLVYIDLSNSYGVEDEEEILNLLKMDMAKLEYLDISYIRFRNPKYPSKQAFANAFWQHVADYVIYRWPNMQTVTAYGYPLKSAANALKIAQEVQNINATVSSARTARTMLKKMPEQTAKYSNLCDKWSGLISAGKTQYTNTGGAQIPIDNEFVSVLVPSHIEIDVDRIEGEVAASIKTILTNTPLDVSIAIAFPFFAAMNSRRKSPQYTPEEVELLVVLCQKAFKMGLDEKYAMQLELFLTELTKGDYNKEAVAILYTERDEVGHNIFTRRFGSGSSSSGRRLLASVENCIKQSTSGV